MTMSGAPQVECEQHHASLAVSDVRTAVDFYTSKLGFWLAFTWGDPPTIAGVNLGQVQIFLEQGTPNPEGCSVYFVVGNADELYEFQRAKGVEVVDPPGDRPWGLRDYSVRDLHGYGLEERPVERHIRPIRAHTGLLARDPDAMDRDPPIGLVDVDPLLELEGRDGCGDHLGLQGSAEASQ